MSVLKKFECLQLFKTFHIFPALEEFARSINQVVDNFFITSNLCQFRQIVCPVVQSFRIWRFSDGLHSFSAALVSRTFFSLVSLSWIVSVPSTFALIALSISSCFRPIVFKPWALSYLRSSSLRAYTAIRHPPYWVCTYHSLAFELRFPGHLCVWNILGKGYLLLQEPVRRLNPRKRVARGGKLWSSETLLYPNISN